ncbi:MAG: hypothetical protein Q8O87_03585 [bacterium]|nr:hypothetical protein [bacterium]
MILHPFLFAIFPILFLFARNIEEVTWGHVYVPVLLSLVLAALLLLLVRIFMRDWLKSGVVASVWLLLIFSYGHIYDVIYKLGEGVVWVPHKVLLIVWLVILSVAFYLVRKSKVDFKVINRGLNFMAGFLVALSLINILLHQSPLDVRPTDSSAQPVGQSAAIDNPDIYFILLDGYSGQQNLEEFYGYDNSSFLNDLKSRGFYVADKSLSNYATTRSSLPSALNMDYLDALSPTGEAEYVRKNFFVHNELVNNNAISRLLKDSGYAYIHFGSMWELTAKNPYADINVNKQSLSEFLAILYRTTAFYPFNYVIGDWLNLDVRQAQWDRIYYQFEELAKMPDLEVGSPKFIFFHVGIPHGPYVFNQNGSFVVEEKDPAVGWEHAPESYLNQSIFLNRQLIIAIDSILSQSKQPPVIILWSDHASRAIVLDKDVDRVADISDVALRSYFRNFGAYLLPDNGADELYKTITPVNIFRVVLNKYFGANLQLLPDISYMDTPKSGYKYEDVTSRVAYE